MIDPVSMYLVNGAKPVGSGMEQAYIAPVDAERRRQQTGQQQTQDQSNQGQDTGVVVSISEEARSQARMGSMLASEAAEMPAEETQVQSYTEDSVNETPSSGNEDANQISKDQSLLRSEAQYQAAGAMAMASRSLLGKTGENEQVEGSEQQNLVEESASASAPADTFNAARPMEVASYEDMGAAATQNAETVENQTPMERASENTEPNRGMEYLSKTPFSYASQTYQGMTTRMEPLMSSFMLGA